MEQHRASGSVIFTPMTSRFIKEYTHSVVETTDCHCLQIQLHTVYHSDTKKYLTHLLFERGWMVVAKSFSKEIEELKSSRKPTIE